MTNEHGTPAIDRFAYFPGGSAHDKLSTCCKTLAEVAMPEEWKTIDEDGIEHPYGLLENYLKYCYAFINDTQREKIRESSDGKWAVFDTRLVSTFALGVEPIYMLFQENYNVGKQPWCFKAWCVGWGNVTRMTTDRDTRRMAFGSKPPEPFDTEISSNELPPWWKDFDGTLDLQYDALHILEDNHERLRDALTEPGAALPSKDDIAAKLKMAIDAARNPRLNPRRMLPQLYRPGGIWGEGSQWVRQLLMPLHLRGGAAADVALTVDLREDPDEPGRWFYFSSTVLSLGAAYMNARLCNSVESPWLRSAVAAEQHAQPVERSSRSSGHSRGSSRHPSPPRAVDDAAGQRAEDVGDAQPLEVGSPPEAGEKVEARYLPTSRWKPATFVRMHAEQATVKFDDYGDEVPLPMERVKRFAESARDSLVSAAAAASSAA